NPFVVAPDGEPATVRAEGESLVADVEGNRQDDFTALDVPDAGLIGAIPVRGKMPRREEPAVGAELQDPGPAAGTREAVDDAVIRDAADDDRALGIAPGVALQAGVEGGILYQDPRRGDGP